MPTDRSVATAPDGRRFGIGRLRWLAVAGLAIAVGTGYWVLRDPIEIVDSLAASEDRLRSFAADRPVTTAVAAFGLYVVVTGLSLPGATLLTLACGWLFGFWRGLVLVSFASTAGATAAFLLSRYLFRDIVQERFRAQLDRFHSAWETEGAWYLLSLRLLVVVPFFVINLVMGLTPIRLWTYWWVSQVGMLPATAVYTYAGASFPTLKDLAETGPAGILTGQVIFALVLLAVFPLVLRFLVRRWSAISPPSG